MVSTVKAFDAERGFGFLTAGDGGKDVFLHVTDVHGKGRNNLNKGDKVEHEVAVTDKGRRAVQAIKL